MQSFMKKGIVNNLLSLSLFTFNNIHINCVLILEKMCRKCVFLAKI
ncbi:hypothetical protein COPEUT_01186 [Coprococcus eutactus ATCC 27759]|nr:hypothetical protein COPEUT_01186 [Coprococcus eutactus ATCC 27759]